MNKEENLQKLAEQLKEMPSKVDPKLWANISGQIGTAAAVGASGGAATSGFTVGKMIAAVVIGATVITTGVVLLNEDETIKDTTNVEATSEIAKSDITDFDMNNAELTENKQPEASTMVKDDSAGENETIEFSKAVNEEINDAVVDEQIIAGLKQSGSTAEGDKPLIVKQRKAEPIISKETPMPTSTIDEPVNKILEDEVEETAIVVDEVDNGGIDQLPNIFTPNNDGENDYFFVTSHDLRDFSLVIMNASTGEKVWLTKDPNEKWNGISLKNEPVPDGRYMYFVAGVDKAGNPVSASKTIIYF